MEEWWSVVAVFWALYLADCLGGGRRERLWLASWRRGYGRGLAPRPDHAPAPAAGREAGREAGRGKSRQGRKAARASAPRPAPVPVLRRFATLTQSRWYFAPPWPWAWVLALDDSPLSLAPEGVGNWPSASSARPPGTPDALRAVRWEDMGKISGGVNSPLRIDGRPIAPANAALDSVGLRELAERLRPLESAARGREIAAWQARWFSPTRARRRLLVGLGRTRWLAVFNTLQWLGWIALSAGLLGEFFNPETVLTEGVRGSPWWALVFWLVLAHFLAVGEAWRVHRRLWPKRGEERTGLVFAALFLPAQALRLRAAILKPAARGLSPLAAVLAAGREETVRRVAANTLRDLAHPMRPAGLPALLARLADEAGALARPAMERALAEAAAAGLTGVSPAELLALPACPASGACAYCPRCGDEFTRLDGACPHGVALRPLKPKDGAGPP